MYGGEIRRTKMMKDAWVKAALTDDTMVVELLCRLKQSLPGCCASSPPSAVHSTLRWGHRQPRSKKAMILKKNNETRTVGSSPTTPLFWSAGSSSPSDGYNESSDNSDRSSGSRSKGAFSGETNITCTKRSRRKKTFTELKEETSLVNEMTNLKRELASLHLNLKEQMQRSENLKKIKLDFHSPSANDTCPVLKEPESRELNEGNKKEASNEDIGGSVLSRHPTEGDLVSSESCKLQKDVETQECFVLPDLNMTPPEEEFVPDGSYAMG